MNLLSKISKKLPFVKEIKNIAKAYIFLGDNKYTSNAVTFNQFWKQIGFKFTCCFFFSITIFLVSLFTDTKIKSTEVNDLIMGIFPDLLGFGIGVYALVHVLSASYYQGIQKKFEDGGKIQPTTLNSDMAYPLIAMCFVLLASIILEFIPSGKITVFINLNLLIYGMAMVFELIYVLFLYTQKHLTDISKK